MGTAEIYRAVLSLDEVVDALVVDLPREGTQGWMPLFVVLRDGATLDDALVAGSGSVIRATARRATCRTRSVEVPSVPRTLSGKVLEVPVKRILCGEPADTRPEPRLARQPGALRPFEELAATPPSRRRTDDLRRRRRALRADAVPSSGTQRAEAPGDLARVLEQLRRPTGRSRRAARSSAVRSTSGITHFDLANNYGPPYGSAEETFGRLLATDLAPYRDELLVSTKAGYDMWPGPYGEWGSRKYLLASLDQSLRRMGLDYVDIFYSHRLDPTTPLEETMGALDAAVRQGKALYAGISSYSPSRTREAAAILDRLGTPLLIHQPSYSLLNRWIEGGLLDTLGELGVGCIGFSPLAQGLLTDRYANGIPEDSRIARDLSLTEEQLTDQTRAKVARPRGDRRGAGTVARGDGARVDAARRRA